MPPLNRHRSTSRAFETTMPPREVLSVEALLAPDQLPLLVTLGALDLDTWALPLLDAGCGGICLVGLATEDGPTAQFFVALYAELRKGHPLSHAAWNARLQCAQPPNARGADFTALAMRVYGAARLIPWPPSAPPKVGKSLDARRRGPMALQRRVPAWLPVHGGSRCRRQYLAFVSAGVSVCNAHRQRSAVRTHFELSRMVCCSMPLTPCCTW